MVRENLEIEEESGGNCCGKIVASCCIPKNGRIRYDRGREKYDRVCIN